jgi:hypothetical protein
MEGGWPNRGCNKSSFVLSLLAFFFFSFESLSKTVTCSWCHHPLRAGDRKHLALHVRYYLNIPALDRYWRGALCSIICSTANQDDPWFRAWEFLEVPRDSVYSGKHVVIKMGITFHFSFFTTHYRHYCAKHNLRKYLLKSSDTL